MHISATRVNILKLFSVSQCQRGDWETLDLRIWVTIATLMDIYLTKAHCAHILKASYEKLMMKTMSGGKYYKTFYGRNLKIFLIS
jgi:hypothetical protein